MFFKRRQPEKGEDENETIKIKKKDLSKYVDYKGKIRSEPPAGWYDESYMYEDSSDDNIASEYIARFSGMRKNAVEEFLKSNKIDSAKVFQTATAKKSKRRKEIVDLFFNAIAGGHKPSITKIKKEFLTDSYMYEGYTDQTGDKSDFLKQLSHEDLLSWKEHKWAGSSDVKMFNWKSSFVFTDGKRAMIVSSRKPYSIIKKLGRASKEVADLMKD